MNPVLYAVLLLASLGSGLMSGVFFAFSSFVMAGLAALPSAEGPAAMQSINRTAVRPMFMAALFGTAAISLGVAVWAVIDWGQPWAQEALAGALLYLIGAIVVTAARNVPMNDALAALDRGAESAPEQWQGYVAQWTAWNHVRVIGSLGAATAFIVALVQG